MPTTRRTFAILTAAAALTALAACAGGMAPAAPGTPSATAVSGPPIVGPPQGTVLVVGGGQQGLELYQAFIDGAGGPNALIVDIPTAGGDTTYPANWRGTNGLKGAGAKRVVVLHSNPNQKELANSDSFVTILRQAGGVWFEGGRQFHLVDSYAGTRTETEIRNVLRRGGIVGGSSAGASILGSFMVRGAPSGNNRIMEYPSYTTGFGYLRNTGIDQHVVSRMRLPDIADSLMPRHPGMLFISEDEGTAWRITGDMAEILGRNKAFVYHGNDPTDAGKPFLTLFPGDKYDLGRRRVVSRAIDQSPLTVPFVDSIFAAFTSNGAKATVHVAQEGRVLLAKGYGIPPQERFMPVTAMPQFPIGDIGKAFPTPASRAFGAQRTKVADDGSITSNVDDLYRWELGLRASDEARAGDAGRASADTTAPGWRRDSYRGLPRQMAAVTGDGKQGAYIRIPGHEVSVIILTDQPSFDARATGEKILDRLLFAHRDRSLFRSTALSTRSSCRSLSAASAQVAWAGCTGGKVFRTLDGGATWQVDSVQGAAALDFRGIKAFDANSAVVVSAGPAERGQARIFRTDDGAKTWTETWSDTTKGIFLDGVAFWDSQHGFTFSDPVGGRFVILTTADGGRSWTRVAPSAIPATLPNEAAFAASNTQLTVQGESNGWIATGGAAEARVYRTTDRGRTWSVATTGMAGGASSGLFGIAFADAMNGIAIGGDYRNERGVTSFALRTRDGGVTWAPAGVQRPDGTTSGTVYVPGSNPALFVAVGQTGVAFSRDFGASWIHADTTTAWGVSFANSAVGFVAGARGHVASLAQPLDRIK